MSRWMPPIPVEQLYSPPARALGAGLALLLWCYDGVERDGTVRINLDDIAREFDCSYRTIKEWWRLLRTGPFFAAIADHGRNGFVARFADDWLEWRILVNNYPLKDISRPDEGQNTAPDSEEQPVKDISRPDEGQNTAPDSEEQPVKDISRPDEGQNTAPDLYKVLHDDHIPPLPSEVGAALLAPPPAPRKRSRDKRPGDPNQQHPACMAYAALTGKRPNRVQAAAIANTITPECVPKWQHTMAAWLGAGWSSQNVTGMLDRYRKDQRNGTAILSAASSAAPNGTGVAAGRDLRSPPAAVQYRTGGAVRPPARRHDPPVPELQPAGGGAREPGDVQGPADEVPE